jgi:hypothetical protein
MFAKKLVLKPEDGCIAGVMPTDASIIEVAPPPQSRMSDWYRDAALLDAFAMQIPLGSGSDVRALGKAVLGRQPSWFKPLLRIRDGVVRQLGIQTSADIRAAEDGRERIDFFPIISIHDDELILGEDDRHLDVRISLLVEKDVNGSDCVVVTTAVRCHNRLGYAYLVAIGPFHRLAVKSYLRRAAKARFQ